MFLIDTPLSILLSSSRLSRSPSLSHAPSPSLSLSLCLHLSPGLAIAMGTATWVTLLIIIVIPTNMAASSESAHRQFCITGGLSSYEVHTTHDYVVLPRDILWHFG